MVSKLERSPVLAAHRALGARCARVLSMGALAVMSVLGLAGCAAGVGFGISLAPGVSLHLGMGSGGPSVGLGTGVGPVGAGVSVDSAGRVVGSAGVGVSAGPVGVGVGQSAVLYDPQRRPDLPAGVEPGWVVPSPAYPATPQDPR